MYCFIAPEMPAYSAFSSFSFLMNTYFASGSSTRLVFTYPSEYARFSSVVSGAYDSSHRRAATADASGTNFRMASNTACTVDKKNFITTGEMRCQ